MSGGEGEIGEGPYAEEGNCGRGVSGEDGKDFEVGRGGGRCEEGGVRGAVDVGGFGGGGG